MLAQTLASAGSILPAGGVEGVLKISQGHAHAHAKKGPATFLSLSHTVSLCRYIRHPSRILQTLWREEGKSGIEHDMTAT